MNVLERYIRRSTYFISHPEECDCVLANLCVLWRLFSYEDDLPEQWSDYYRANADFFKEIGPPVVPHPLVL